MEALKMDGGAFNSPVTEAIQAAKAGDIYIFKDILVRCPGDATDREMGAIVFEVTN